MRKPLKGQALIPTVSATALQESVQCRLEPSGPRHSPRDGQNQGSTHEAEQPAMKRILLFLATNLAIVVVLSIVARLLGVDQWLYARGSSLTSLLVFAAVFGFSGSLISLAISKWMAK